MAGKFRVISLEEIEKQNGYMAKVSSQNEECFARTGERRKAFVLTLGCQPNQSDREKLAGMAEQMGYEIVDHPEDAHLIVVNTCAIREHAEKRALSLVGQYKLIKAKFIIV